MVRKKAVVKNLNEEKENNNRLIEYTNNRTDVTTVCPITVGQKRPIELVDLNTVDSEEIEINKIKKRCFDLEQRVENLEKRCLVIPQHMTSIQDFFNDTMQSLNNNNIDIMMLDNDDFVKFNNENIVKINDNLIPINTEVVQINDQIIAMNNDIVQTNDHIIPMNNNLIPINNEVVQIDDQIIAMNNDIVQINDHIIPMNNNVIQINDHMIPMKNDVIKFNDHSIPINNNDDDKTGNPFAIFIIDDIILASLKKQNATSTARSIMKHLYPNPNIDLKLSNMSKGDVDGIVDCVKKMHPNESTTTAKIKHAMSNYFGSINYRKKNKLPITKE